MAPFKFAALALGSLALPTATGASTSATFDNKTDTVIQWFNLYRNGRIDSQLPDINKITKTITDKQGEFLTVSEDPKTYIRSAAGAQSGTKNCTVKEHAYQKGLVLKLIPEMGDNYGKLLDEALNTALPNLLETPTHVVCNVTTDCKENYLFCKFAKDAEGSSLIEEVVDVKNEFVQAVEARKNANIKIADLKSTDAHTPLTSGASKVTVSALAMLVVLASALLI